MKDASKRGATIAEAESKHTAAHDEYLQHRRKGPVPDDIQQRLDEAEAALEAAYGLEDTFDCVFCSRTNIPYTEPGWQQLVVLGIVWHHSFEDVDEETGEKITRHTNQTLEFQRGAEQVLMRCAQCVAQLDLKTKLDFPA